MLFNSISFLASFATLVVVYYALAPRARWILLLAASLGFYATFRVSYVLLLIAITLIAYVTGLHIGASTDHARRKAMLVAGTVSVLAAFFVFRYFDFVAQSIDAVLVQAGLTTSVPVLPRLNLVVVAGLSFYTFSCLSYIVDVYASRLTPERHLGYFALYVSFFPKILAGPIERARPFLAQVRQPAQFSASGVTAGLQQMLWGLFKKSVIADRLALFVDTAYSNVAFAPSADLLLATYFFALQLYCDFSGYSDIAIGAAKVLGIDLSENFRRPYLSTSVAEFWARRWHLSLSTWFRDYVYIPLGGSRVPQFRHCRNVMIVFLLSGLWHGANWTFVIWGGLNGLYVVASILSTELRQKATAAIRVPSGLGSVLRGMLTFHLVLVTWVFFRAASMSDALTVLTRVGDSMNLLPGLLLARVRRGEVVPSLVLIAILFVVEAVDEKRPVWDRLEAQPVYIRWAAYYALGLSLIVFGVWNFQQFVYMQF